MADTAAQEQPPPPAHVAFVGNLPFATTDADLQEMFGACGACVGRARGRIWGCR